LAEFNTKGAVVMITAQQICLLLMLAIGAVSFVLLAEWDIMSRRRQFLLLAWLVFWLGPPLYFIWTKGVMG
jgi:hypothetical protein